MTQLLIRLFVRHPDDTKNAAVRTAYGNLASLVGMACNLLLCLGKLAAGTLFGSIAIMADALNNLSDASSNVVSLVPLTNHASSNLMVTLEDAPYPVVLHLITESQARRGRVGDALVAFRLDRGGPNAKPAVLAPPAPEAVSADLLEFVHGVPPDGARPVRLEPEYPGTRAWLYRDRIYLRTGHHAVWPAWLSRAGCGGLTVYALPRAPFVVLSVGGERVKLMTGLASGEAGRRHE